MKNNSTIEVFYTLYEISKGIIHQFSTQPGHELNFMVVVKKNVDKTSSYLYKLIYYLENRFELHRRIPCRTGQQPLQA
ncbi:MAG: hypothetical protein QGH62_02015 [Nitrospinaceae bacterium]|nr:hypothetical protein [Nitrospinaceae bacterium]